MAGRQRIDRVRRQYNQWVANQTLEDYALRFTAKSARRWSAARVANTALGAISFLALEAIGGTITLNYGAMNASAAILVVSVIIFLCGLPIAYHAAKSGIDIDLLTRGAGFGYIGSTITSLIYASFTFIFFAIEAVILASALDMCFGIPRPIGYLISAVVIIPLVIYGITLISRFQLWTQPLWIILHIMPFAAIAWANPHSFTEWRKFAGDHGDPAGNLDLLLFGTAASVVFALVAQIGEQVDFLRFLPRDRRTSRKAWWIALLSAGPGWIVLGALKLLAGSFLAFFALSHGVSAEHAAEPANMYLEAFRYVLSQPDLAMALTGTFVILSQVKINVTNAYAGSIAWSNFFSRLTHSHPGRVVWLVFNVVVALLLMEIGVYKALEQTLALYSNVAIAWVGALVADLVVNKPLGLRPQHIEFKRAHLCDINPVGVGAMTIATVVSISAFYGLFGPTAKALSAFVALAVAFVTAPLIAWATDGKYYIARKPKRSWQNIESIQCCICEHAFEPEDMASCPAYAGPICSLCCSLDARCHDLCKPHGRIGAQVSDALGKVMPQPIYARLNSQLGHYLGVFAVSAGLVALVLGLIYLQTTAAVHANELLADVLWKVFFALTLIIGVVAWLFVLAQQSRRAAEAETRRQTTLLIQEIDAHKRTDAELQRAKEVAESANLAKSRYVVGLSHELRSPLNAISGYAQLLEQDDSLQVRPREQVRVVRRSADHLSGLIDGILDISKIEAGRLYLSRDEVRLNDFLEQLVGMFRLQAAAKGIDFVFKRPAVLPVVVYADEKRLRQILINLLSNAIKFTQSGQVQFVVHYRSPVAEFEVIDTGPGIQPDDLERIFAPFERGALGVTQPQTGTGLGLTISRLLAGVMGGDIKVLSTVGTGSTFRVKLLLSEVTNPRRDAPVDAPVYGYHGPRRTILITDDDPTHRDLLREILTPLGFILLSAPDGPGCLALAQHCRPDLFLLDISMAGMDGWTVAETLRSEGHHQARILMISASALEAHGAPLAQPFHDGYLMKPIDIPRLLETIRQLLKIEWQYEAEPAAPPQWKPESGSRPPVKYVEELISLGQLGYVRAIQLKLDEIGNECPEHADFVGQMRTLIDRFDLDQYMATLKTLHSYDH
ncbi:signal transduction histidine kinase/purine-cytosine permease-like protein/ActR/RegA family two-component response regulator [Bradyrhizobium sp. USDA 4524]|uniref:hybrid sensor histidine kinase/response regulator n=1 Tax=unclassified Bradyrhizobium TaxID=2631580 RepID=UPI00209D60AD|nr:MULTISPECIES: ATP-binding protein [unclassified Bradyrhizobium]MCP1837239.1 signal transduction histidine kinase/purine-cytosine permease-like protein/ActR/RegA family two-component response regulator [Bradyrhizobium sp. USDA 4538]MCP1906257.1 signal transduction histidine kinase/purine-cytosine permease-like protein/ActR/RegA family two-component response regulator [Bradyrhizobium sp. USDA 4537]MCP1988088.1 signal transduction histidine kinase/purine-cytosine permease-like protein/ActR/RegA 